MDHISIPRILEADWSQVTSLEWGVNWESEFKWMLSFQSQLPRRRWRWGYLSCRNTPIFFFSYFLFFFWPCCAACGILVPQPVSPAVEARRPNHWTAREVPPSFSFLTDIWLIYNVVLVSAVQQSDSFIYMCIYIYIYIYIYIHILFLMFFSIMVYQRILNIVPCAI